MSELPPPAPKPKRFQVIWPNHTQSYAGITGSARDGDYLIMTSPGGDVIVNIRKAMWVEVEDE